MDIIVPQVGESIVEAEIGEWFKQDGEQVEKDNLLLELETEKVNVELNAEASGKLTILAQQGDTVKVGAVVGKIDESATGTEKKPAPKEAAEDSQEQKTADSEPETAEQADEQPPEEPDEAAKSEPVAMNPAVAKIAAERGIDLAQIKGSGRDGRILVDDLPAEGETTDQPAAQQAEPEAEAEAESESEAEAGPKAAPEKSKEERIKRVPMTQIRKKIAAHLLMARQQTAMLTTFNEIDMSRVIKLRATHKDAFQKKHGVPLGFMSFFVKATAEALKDFPDVNARIDGNDIVYHNYYDIGIAVGSKRGLVVPVIRDADRLHFDEIEKTIRAFADKAETGKLTIDDLQGGTFTISNGGIYGSVLSTPLLNPPQSGILGMHAIKDRAVVIDGEIVVRPIMNVALSYDHRIIDGQQAVGFLKQLKTFIEDPEQMLLEM